MLENPALRSLGSAGLQSQGFSTIPGREWEPSAQLCCYYFLFPCKEGSYRLATALLSPAILKKWKPLSAYTRATSGMEWVRMCVCLWRDASTAMHAKLQGQWKEPSCKATRWGTSGPSPFRHPRYILVIIDQFTRWVCPWPRAWDDSKETCVQLYCSIWTPSWVARQPVSRLWEFSVTECMQGPADHKDNTLYHPASNKQVEQLNRTLLQMIRYVN